MPYRYLLFRLDCLHTNERRELIEISEKSIYNFFRTIIVVRHSDKVPAFYFDFRFLAFVIIT